MTLQYKPTFNVFPGLVNPDKSFIVNVGHHNFERRCIILEDLGSWLSIENRLFRDNKARRSQDLVHVIEVEDHGALPSEYVLVLRASLRTGMWAHPKVTTVGGMSAPVRSCSEQPNPEQVAGWDDRVGVVEGDILPIVQKEFATCEGGQRQCREAAEIVGLSIVELRLKLRPTIAVLRDKTGRALDAMAARRGYLGIAQTLNTTFGIWSLDLIQQTFGSTGIVSSLKPG
ncbi:hypothetical protein DFH06DRAFT_1135999 [Mycena polygramma]|nr:hypothetical protein DFH06DRAFT_1135999 [Mycena polygramma]